MGCVQREFDGTLWFITFRDSPKTIDLQEDRRVLVSYSRGKFEYVLVSGQARVVEDNPSLHSLWSEGLRVWFPQGPDSPDLVLIAIDVERAKAWTQGASLVRYAWLYVRARLTGRRPRADEVVTLTTFTFELPRPAGIYRSQGG